MKVCIARCRGIQSVPRERQNKGINDMAATLEHETFSRHLNTTFRIFLDESNTVEAELSTVGELQLSARQERFAIIFRGPKESLLPQGSYRFEHDEIGELILFIVP